MSDAAPEVVPAVEIWTDSEQFKKMYELVSDWAKRLEWCLDDYELSNIARRFNRYIKEGKYYSAAMILAFLEDINYHTECEDFVDGKADKYILSK